MANVKLHVWIDPDAKLQWLVGMGHAGVEFQHNGDDKYATWLDHGGAIVSGGAGGASYAVDTYTYKDDEKRLNGAREFIFPYPVFEGINVGLMPNAIWGWWQRKLMQPKEDRIYKLVSKEHNCNGVSLKALIAGGAELFLEKPRNVVAQDARTLKEYGHELLNTIREWNALNQEHLPKAKVKYLADRSCPDMDLFADIPTLTEWKAKSSGGVGSVRHEQVAEIDRLLGWRDKFVGMPLVALANRLVQVKCAEHLMTKVSSAYRLPVGSLFRAVSKKTR